jgi:hypothetical protein
MERAWLVNQVVSPTKGDPTQLAWVVNQVVS